MSTDPVSYRSEAPPGGAPRRPAGFGGWPYVAGLLCILAWFTAAKAPYFGVPFTGYHSLKYNTYVEPALYMAQRNDPTWYQAKYKSDPVENPKGIFRHFYDFPLFEWGLFATYEIFPSAPIETKTRLYTHAIGILLLVLAYLFYRKWVPDSLALLTVFMMSVNPIVVFGTFVTILDGLNMALMFASFSLLTRCRETPRSARLFWAGLLFGVGTAVKYSMLLWTAPIALLLFYYQRTSRFGWVRDFLIYGFLGVLFVAANVTSVARLPGGGIAPAAAAGAWAGVFVALHRLIVRREETLDRWIDAALRKKVALALFGVAVLVAAKLLYDALNVRALANHYLTDTTLLFNGKYYLYMLRVQFKSYITPTYFWVGAAGIALSLAAGTPESRRMTLAFLFGSAVYLVLVSKTIFVHNYYTMIIMILFSMGAAALIHQVLGGLRNATAKAVVLGLFAVLILPRAHEQAASMLGHYEDVRGIGRYLVENTRDDDVILNNTLLTPIAIYTGRSFAFVSSLGHESVAAEIRRAGFAQAMRKYRIKYFFSEGGRDPFIDFAPLFSETEVKDPRFNDRRFIAERIGETGDATARQYEELERIVETHRIAANFRLAAEFGKYRLYSFVDDPAGGSAAAPAGREGSAP